MPPPPFGLDLDFGDDETGFLDASDPSAAVSAGIPMGHALGSGKRRAGAMGALSKALGDKAGGLAGGGSLFGAFGMGGGGGSGGASGGGGGRGFPALPGSPANSAPGASESAEIDRPPALVKRRSSSNFLRDDAFVFLDRVSLSETQQRRAQVRG